MNKYKVKVEYTFECEFEIEADNKKEAKKDAIDSCGAVNPNYHSTVTNDWNGNIHPIKEVIKSIK